jgi:hypothetical protein
VFLARAWCCSKAGQPAWALCLPLGVAYGDVPLVLGLMRQAPVTEVFPLPWARLQEVVTFLVSGLAAPSWSRKKMCAQAVVEMTKVRCTWASNTSLGPQSPSITLARVLCKVPAPAFQTVACALTPACSYHGVGCCLYLSTHVHLPLCSQGSVRLVDDLRSA